MKKIYCIALVILSLFSCVLFSACGDKYKKFGMTFCSTDGEAISSLNFVLDSDKEDVSQRILIKFNNIDKDDIGEIVVFSSPENLVTTSDYVYEGKFCYLTINPEKVSESGAKLIVKHYASGKTSSIDLTIKQKSKDVQINFKNYLVSIPTVKANTHYVDFNKVLNLIPQTSTDNVYFKLATGETLLYGVTAIAVEGKEGCFSGFNVPVGIDEFKVNIYPVTYHEGYDLESNKYASKIITIHFKNVLNADSISLKYGDEAVPNPIELIYNDNKLDSAIIDIYNGEEVINTNFFDMYDLNLSSNALGTISVLSTSNNKIVINAIANVQNAVVKMNLTPKNYVGDIYAITKTINVNVETKADTISVDKNGETIDVAQNTTIFDYYSEGNSLGSLFVFKPMAYTMAEVHKDLKQMCIEIDPEILNADVSGVDKDLMEVYTDKTFTTKSNSNDYTYTPSGAVSSITKTTKSKLYALVFHKFNNTLKFYFDATTGKMISEPFNEKDRIYIKYTDGNGESEPSNFGINIKTLNTSTISYWQKISAVDISLNFERQEGVKSMSLGAGLHHIDGTQKWTPYDTTNLERLNINRDDGPIDIAIKYYLYIAEIKGVDNLDISKADFEIVVKPVSGDPINRLLVARKENVSSYPATDKLNYSYNSTDLGHGIVIGLVFDANTDIGDYKISFYQADIEKASVVCTIYETLTAIDDNNIELETNQKAFKNVKPDGSHLYESYNADYIVAAGQEIDISVLLSEDVIKSKIVAGYSFTASDTEFIFANQEISTDNFASLEFKKGTIIGGEKKSITLTIQVKTYGYETIVAEPTPQELVGNRIEVTFFIYEPIGKDDISINYTNATRYMKENLGVYNQTEAELQLKINMRPELWQYVTTENYVKWSLDTNAGVESNENSDEKTNKLTFSKQPGSSYKRVVKAQVHQFNDIFYFECLVDVKKPIISESVAIKQKLKSKQTDNGNYYINLKNNETFTLEADNVSSLGTVTHKGIRIQVADRQQGSAFLAREYFQIDQDTSTIKVLKVDALYKFKLIVFAEDALKYEATSDLSSYNNPSSLLMEGDGENPDLYKRAYFVIDIELSDGSVDNPYLITTSDELFAIDDQESFKESHYKLMNSLILDNLQVINNFKGTIVTDSDYTFIISGITLTDSESGVTNLFTNFSGAISNIKFVVNYKYYGTYAYGNLGLFTTNDGSLKNVFVEVGGFATLKENTYFGALVGENAGTIQYDSGVAVSGEITLDGAIDSTNKAYFGGLVGKNVGKIISNQETEETRTGIVFNTSSGITQALSTIRINSNLTGDCAIGGAVGLNTNNGTTIGVIQNVFVQTVIDATSTSNIGGVIGENNVGLMVIMANISDIGNHLSLITDVLAYDTDSDGNGANDSSSFVLKSIYKVKSASIINANNNVGGIVGLDNGGLYIDCDYQILPPANITKNIALKGNDNVGGIAGESNYGHFFYCSVFSYNWNYNQFNTGSTTIIAENAVADISGNDYIGGIVGNARSVTTGLSVGDNKISDRVIIAYSSVNAYLQTTKEREIDETTNIGGVLSSSEGVGVVYSVYFIGKLEDKAESKGEIFTKYITTTNNGVTYHKFNFANNNNAIENDVYTLSIVADKNDTNFNIGHVKGGDKSDITDPKNGFSWIFSKDYWGYNAEYNGGYIFVTTDKSATSESLPIFDIAPDSINVKVKGKAATDPLLRTLVLDYYDFSNNETKTGIPNLNNTYNVKDLIGSNGLLDITVSPNMPYIVLNVTSSNVSVVNIGLNGKLIINGVGETILTFSSVLNPNAGNIEDRTIKVIVDYPIGDGNKFIVSLSRTDENRRVNDTTISIPQNTSKQLYVITEGSKEYSSIIYKYKTLTNVNLRVEISTTETLETGKTIEDYIKVSGLTGVESADGKTITFNVDKNAPFAISMLKHLEGGIFSVKVTPYKSVQGQVFEYPNLSTPATDDVIFCNFNVTSARGVTDVAFSYDHAIVYPNDTVYLTGNLNTDKEIDSPNLIKLFSLTNTENVAGLLFKVTNERSLPFNINVDSSSYDGDNKIQTVVLRIEFEDVTLNTTADLHLKLETELGTFAKVEFKLLPQRINKIDIRNYYYTNPTEGIKEISNILKPSNPGLIVLDIVPNNGYYDYLEISDITGSEEILFIQVDENNKVINPSGDLLSSDRKGIKLTKTSTSVSRMYVITQIDKNYSSRIHTIEVRAYLDNGQQIGVGYTKEIDVRMLPEVTVDYIMPNGRVGRAVQSGTNATGVYLATGVHANLRISTKNSDGIVIPTLSGNAKDDYELVLEAGNHYLLKAKRKATINSNNSGDELTLTLKTYSYMENGDYDVAETSIGFEITNFVIHDISVNSSIERADSQEIYGYYDRPIKLNFYFDKDDISYYDTTSGNDFFWDTVYTYDPSYASKYEEGGDLYQIYSILEALNKIDGDNPYLIVREFNSNLRKFNDLQSHSKISLNDNKLTIKDEYNKDTSKYLAIALKMYKNGDSWVSINKYDKANYSNNDKKYQENSISGLYNIDKNYLLNFTEITPWYEPKVVTNQKEFEEMQSGGRYILKNDLTLKNYTPINANLMEFDGNGYTITIESFAKFKEEVINAGLFAQIYSDMVVKNIKLEYSTQEVEHSYNEYTLGNVSRANGITFTDICNDAENVNYSEVNFGGIAAVNNGVITNCYVKGLVAFNASTIEEKKSASGGSYKINFFIGGVVATNSSTGYITNSVTELNIFAQANIGAFVYENNGKIASCSVEEDTTIYSYNTNLEKTIINEISGFVVTNGGNISMSYVNLNAKYEATFPEEIKKGAISAKDISAGFAYLNKNIISDCYVQMSETGINNNTFSGFVNSNNGTVIRAYTYINAGIKNESENMFAPAGSKGLEDCIEVKVYKAGYSNGVERGLHTLDTSSRYSKLNYEQHNFTFGDNKNAVWSIVSGHLPELSSTKELDIDKFAKLSITSETVIEDGVEKTKYTTHFANYGTKTNPFIVNDLESWKNYFTDSKNNKSYFRIVKDIDFTTIGDNPYTSSTEFSGNIQGNNMVINGILLYSKDSLDALGLFKSMKNANDIEVSNAVRNLTLKTSSVWASSTQAVGLLAGIIEDFNIYNITIDSQEVIMVGGNAVGGLAGVIRGDVNIGQITSNIGTNSTRATTINNYSIYMSKNNSSSISQNLNNVYYAGSIAGIVDGYNNSGLSTSSRDITKYLKVENIRVNGKIVVIADTVGAAFGFVGEKVYVKNVKVDISGILAGSQYSAGVVGENRGALENVKVTLADNMFKQAKYVASAVVGLNLGGLVTDVEVLQAKIDKTDHGFTVGGIVGRNVHGNVNNVSFNGDLFAYFTGGIIGVNYSGNIIKQPEVGNGALNNSCKNDNVIPTSDITYIGAENNLTNLTITESTIVKMIDNSTNFYSYEKPDAETPTLSQLTTKYKVMGMLIGLNYNNQTRLFVKDNGSAYKVDYAIDAGKNITFNTGANIKNSEEIEDVILKENKTDATNNIVYTFEQVNQIIFGKGTCVIYLVGSNVSSFNSWNASADGYSSEYVLFK